MSLTKQEIKNYLKAGGVCCPKKSCRSDNLNIIDTCVDYIVTDTGYLFQEIRCEDCGFAWIDEYKLTGIKEAGGDEEHGSR